MRGGKRCQRCINCSKDDQNETHSLKKVKHLESERGEEPLVLAGLISLFKELLDDLEKIGTNISKFKNIKSIANNDNYRPYFLGFLALGRFFESLGGDGALDLLQVKSVTEEITVCEHK